MRHVVLPQAVRRVVPPLLNDFISLQKDVALVSILGPARGLPGGADLRGLDVQLHAACLAAALLYLAVTMPLARIVDRHAGARARHARATAMPA